MRRVVTLLVLAGCGADPVSIGFDTDLAFTLSVTPSTLDVETGPDGAEPVPFTATATFDDGTTTVLEVVDWSLSNRSAGELDAHGVFTPSHRNGGITWVTAELDGVRAQAEVHVRYHEEQVVGAADPSAFAAAAVPTEGHWLYPPDGVNVPRNTSGLRFMWTGVDGAVYRVGFRSAVTDLVWYTDAPELLLDGATWSRVAATNAGGEVEVTLALAVDGQVLEEPARAIEVNRLDATGSIVYWTTNAWVDGAGNGQGGLMRIPFGAQAVEFFTPPNNGGHCVGCHTAGPQGQIALTFDGGNGPLGVIDASGAPVVGYPASGAATIPRANFTTFSPDGRYLVGAEEGALDLWDARTGALVKHVFPGNQATHPAWSPDGTKLAFTLTTGHTYDWTLPSPSSDARIVVMPVTFDAATGEPTFGNWTSLVDPGGTFKAYYPAWSPDGRWLAYNRSAGDMNNDADAELWVIDAEGKREPVRLDAANATGELTNSWPRWAPLPDDDVLWLAFGSTRDYGNRVSGRPQVWVTAFDPKRAKAGEDPSWAAFWLPGQDEAHNNHIPVWTR